MIVCPVCEHPQERGAECDVCGKRLAETDAGAPAIPAVEGLEPTLHGAVEVPIERVGDVEPTIRPAVAHAAGETTPDLDRGRAAPVDVAADTAPDLEATAIAPDDAPTAVPTFVTCRYCRSPSMPGERICARCGMRLPDFGAHERDAREEPLRHCTCGAAVRAGGRCPNCGVRVG